MTYGNRSKTLDAREGYHVIVIANFPMKEMSRQLEKLGLRWKRIVGLFA
jgi:hypothetical protein